MIRGVRGATTVQENDELEILENTKELIEEMINRNNIDAESISHVFISVTNDLNAAFPAKSLRQIPGFVYVPVMCMKEIDVPGSLARCIRVMMVTNTTIHQQNVQHVFHHEAKQLRPDLEQRRKRPF
ncbi:chorismate mutase [Virgibacillus dakarensis]|uniref:chorismate mutase n=1 Tax=Lentibacillus populi TaxID=1827502 RepID=A0A9W5TV04_9BACI|nr:chorismate mutase [Lentibacillus populi]MBT2214263.1 chorismate mutase [Virgibacillus dakarensis]MTW85912.1 chorismate mutase [Virgibacillus dakarensis]GGB33460.1 chorismate mutase AroH [Lentibacillus populi]